MIPVLRKETYYDPKGIMLRFLGKQQSHFDKDFVFDFSHFTDCENAWTEIKERVEKQRWTAQDAKDIALRYLRSDFIKYYYDWLESHQIDSELKKFVVDFRCFKELSMKLKGFLFDYKMDTKRDLMKLTEEEQKELGIILRQIRYCAGEMLSDIDEAAFIYSDDEESTDRQYNQFKKATIK